VARSKSQSLTFAKVANCAFLAVALAVWLGEQPTAAQPARQRATAAPRASTQAAVDRAEAARLAVQIDAEGMRLARLSEQADALGVQAGQLAARLGAARLAADVTAQRLEAARALLIEQAVAAYASSAQLGYELEPASGSNPVLVAGYAGVIAGEQRGAMAGYGSALARERAAAADLSREHDAAEATASAGQGLAISPFQGSPAEKDGVQFQNPGRWPGLC